jgi:putative hydrolase of the HAD superfamily
MVPGITALLERVGRRLPTYGFTNTNHTHLAHCQRSYPELFHYFRHVFTSCTMGRRKPDAAAFAAIGTEIGVPLDRILFFDDTLENVEAARAIGMPAVHVRSLDDVATAVDWIR